MILTGSIEVIRKFTQLLTAPTMEEGFTKVRAISTTEDATSLVAEYICLATARREAACEGSPQPERGRSPANAPAIVGLHDSLPFRPTWGPCDATLVAGGLPRYSSRLLAAGAVPPDDAVSGVLTEIVATAKPGAATQVDRLFCNAHYVGIAGPAIDSAAAQSTRYIRRDYVESRESRQEPLHITLFTPWELQKVRSDRVGTVHSDRLGWMRLLL